jgi:hypothetical protein
MLSNAIRGHMAELGVISAKGRNGTAELLVQAVEAEVAEFLARYADRRTENGRRVVRHGHLPDRSIAPAGCVRN